MEIVGGNGDENLGENLLSEIVPGNGIAKINSPGTVQSSDKGTPEDHNQNAYSAYVDSLLGTATNKTYSLLPMSPVPDMNDLFEPTRLPYEGSFEYPGHHRNNQINHRNGHKTASQSNVNHDSSSDDNLSNFEFGQKLFLPDELRFNPLSLASHALLLDLDEEFPSSTFTFELEQTHLCGINYLDAHKSIEAYDCEVNCLYPIFTVGELKRKFDIIYKHYGLHGVFLPEHENDWLDIKLVIAIGSTMTDVSQTSGKKLYEDVLSKVERRLISGKGSIVALVHLLLIHQYQFHSDMGTLAYRTVGFASIQALELGLYKTKDLEKMFSTEEEREHGRLVFWCLYVMDRRLSIYTKRPFILHDEDIDQRMPQSFGSVSLESSSSEDDLFRAMHLNYMIHYSKLSGKVLEAIQKHQDNASTSGTNSKSNNDNIQYLIFLMERWKSSLPPELRLKENLPSQPSPYGSRKLKWIIYLKSNLILLNIYQTCTLDSYIVPAITTACECIRELGRLYFNTDFYSSCEIQYNHFLVAALEVLYSSLRRQPQYLEKCTAEIKLALKIISLIMKRSTNDRRQGSIWQLVVSFAFKFGLSSPFGAKLLESDTYNATIDREVMLTGLINELGKGDDRISENLM